MEFLIFIFRFLRTKRSCIIIQRAFLAWKKTLAQRKRFLTQRNAVIKIQSTVRMWLARKTVENMKLMKLQNNAATIIQVCWGNELGLKGRVYLKSSIEI